MNNKLALFCIVALLGVSCQKELTDNNLPTFWAVTNITVTNVEAKALVAVYDFEYDSVLRRATTLRFFNPLLGVSKTIYPSYRKDTVYLGSNSFIALDASKRIKQLSETGARPGIQNGDYYYNYNGQGELEERLLDDGSSSDAIRTTFNYDNGDLVKYNQDFKGYPLANTASLTYLNTPRISNFGRYSLLEIFPELLLYMPCINIGKPVLYPLSQINSQILLPAPPTPAYITYYKNFVLTSEGYISSFQTTVQVGTNAPITTQYDFTYRSYQ